MAGASGKPDRHALFAHTPARADRAAITGRYLSQRAVKQPTAATDRIPRRLPLRAKTKAECESSPPVLHLHEADGLFSLNIRANTEPSQHSNRLVKSASS
jgi:hypothetical protein